MARKHPHAIPSNSYTYRRRGTAFINKQGSGKMGKQEATYVYLLGSLESHEIKIGHTWNIRVRMSRHKQERGHPLTLLGFVEMPNRDAAFALEQLLLEKPRAGYGNPRSEWFPFNPSTVADFLTQPGVTVCL
jgi:predicted GIY-YIG superfamily endonuclease